MSIEERALQFQRYHDCPVAIAFLQDVCFRQDPDQFHWQDLAEAEMLRGMFGDAQVKSTVFALADEGPVFSVDAGRAYARHAVKRGLADEFVMPRAIDPSMITQSPTNSEWDRFTVKGVTVDFEAGRDGICIFEMASGNPRAGEGREALLHLQAEYGHINVCGFIADSPDAVGFWRSMLNERIVRKAVDMNGLVMEPSPPIRTVEVSAPGAR